MDKSLAKPVTRRGPWILSTRLHLELYGALLVATPLVMLRVYLQQAIAALSRFQVTVLGVELPLMLSCVTVVAVALLIWNFRRLTWRHVLAAGIVMVMDAVAQQFADYYTEHRFYDLQQNWHYIAYGVFAYMFYRDFEPRGMPLHRIFILTVLLAVVASTLDEEFQRFVNNRVFDISDIAKDTYGTVAGCVMIALCSRRAPEFLKDRRLRYPRLSEYFRHPFSTLILLGAFSFILMMTAALLSDEEYFYTAVALAVICFLIGWMILHITQFRIPRYTLLALLVAAVVAQAYSFWRYRNSGIVYHRFGLTVYRGIPIPYFDIQIGPDGWFRLVDKKHDFVTPDVEHFKRIGSDILLIASGDRAQGGNGLPSKRPSQFVYNSYTGRGLHVLILNTRDACTTFNRLKQEHKNVLFILHNTC